MPVNQANPDITASAAASSTVSAASNNKGINSNTDIVTDNEKLISNDGDNNPEEGNEVNAQNPQNPISSSASTDLLAKNSANTRPLVELTNRKNLDKNGYCRGGASYNYAYSIHKKIIRVDAFYLITIALVIIKMSVHQPRSVYSHYCDLCQISKSNNKLVSLGQNNNRINYIEREPSPAKEFTLRVDQSR